MSTRVKESCLPCRRRKTRCDDSQPCSSCVLRRTEADCRPGSLGQTSSSRPSVATVVPQSSSNGPNVPYPVLDYVPRKGSSAYPPIPPFSDSRTASPSPRTSIGPSIATGNGSLSLRGPDMAYGNGTGKKRRASGPSPRIHAPGAAGGAAYAGVSAAQTQLALNEVARLRASVNALEGQIVGIQAGLQAGRGRVSPYGDGLADEDGAGSDSEGRERWEKVWAALPDLYSCEILLEYIFQECDFLFSYGDILDVWLSAVRMRSVTEAQAGRISIAIAIAALLLGQGAHPYYRPDCDPVALNIRLWELAQTFVSSDPQTIEEVEVLVDITKYLVFSGRHMPMLMHMPLLAMKGGLRIGLFDECHPSWDQLNEVQRERHRQIASDMLANCRWSCLVIKEDPLKYIKVNICEPTWYNQPLDSPIRSIPTDDSYLQSVYGSDPEPDFRLFRLKSTAERKRSRLFTTLITDIGRILPRIKALHTQMQQPNPTPASVETMAHTAMGLHDELCFWLSSKLPENGLPEPTVEDVETTDMVRCKRAAQSLIVNHACTYILSCVLRPWLLAGDRGLAPGSVQKRLHDACLTNADRIMRGIPIIKALLATRTQPVITPWSASNLFNAAMCYAVPLLRSVQKWTGATSASATTEDDIRKLATWAGSHEPIGANPAGAATEEEKPIPPFAYADEVVRTCANHMIKVLDVLSILRVSPLGASAEAKLRQLIKKYGLDSPGHSPEQLQAGAYYYGLPQLAGRSGGAGGGGMNAGPPGGPLSTFPPPPPGIGAGGVAGGGADPSWGGHIWGGPEVFAVSGSLTRDAAALGSQPSSRSEGPAANGLMQLAAAVAGSTDTPPSAGASAAGWQSTNTILAPMSVAPDFTQFGRGGPAIPAGVPSDAMDGSAAQVPELATEQPDWSWFGFEPGLSETQVGGDPALLEQLMQLDSSVWQDLLDPAHDLGI